MAKPDDVRLGQILIRKRWCSLRQINAALASQGGSPGDTSTFRPLSRILVEDGILDGERVKMALSELGCLRLVCPGCKRDRPISGYDPSHSYRCPRCDLDLVLDAELSSSAPPVEPRENPAGHPAGGSGDDLEEDTVVGKVVGGCQILARIARGGMGVVYKAKQLKLGRVVAVKVLSEELARDRKYVHRFLQEAKSAAELNHGNIVHIIDVGELSGLFYIIMEFVDGSSLREILQVQHHLDPLRVVEIALQACHALNHAHKRGIIHRDIKPENIMLTREGVVKIADLGLAKKVHPESQDGGLTQTRAIMGTPYYMAPEQIKDFRQVDGRSDIYSLGVTLFRALTGAVPFEGRTPVEVMIKVVEGKRAPIGALRPGVPPQLESVVDRMMSRRPADRQQSFTEVITDLDAVLRLLREEEHRQSAPVSS